MDLMRVYQMDDGYNEPKTMTINVSEIMKVVDFTGADYVRNTSNPVISDDFISGYIAWLEKEGETHCLEMVNEFSQTIGYGEFEYCNDYETSKDWEVLVTIDGNLEDKMNSNLFIEIEIYEWHDGSNWNTEILDGCNGWQEICEYDNDEINFINIDEFDGNEFCTCNKCNHVKIGKMKDGNYVTDEYSQFLGSHSCGRLLEGDDALKEYLEAINRLDHYDEILLG
ncbi:hypothetical protein K9O30_06070 [Clostridium bowmanii]|uniref:hypothetical protein n=1 Tax=Clostridium bowmanii TaxID=132925 RepID=UPI001C0D42EB|nr:hypothetical protein [Clostridium bowmanii]MBU3188726.1 hypothetical protein [Clostridium bowmanii]MCA1073311.1 hypothetical protein [Clostridium bowmanii]